MVIAAVGYSLFSYFEVTKNTQILLVGAALFVSVKAFLFLLGKGKNRFDVPSKYVYLIGYLIIPVILITKIPQIEKNFNPKIIISIFILIWTNDTFAFLVGKSIGKRKLFERISPKKTVEGFVGGLLAAMVMGVIISIFFIDQPKVNWIITAAILSIFGTIGDLVESKFKRVANIKDSGNIMPGHGGILDRLDSIIFAAPFVFLFYQIISYVP